MPGTITTTLLNFRVTPEQRRLIEHAAKQSNQTMSDLTRAATLWASALIMGTVR